ncbi:putative Receptor-like protein EIX1 [Cocos nucifera]|uniref:Putative Receptor-like protein EIX1 n=1 Tax=Cocos nucifera TaxID=13894 RepID=A0A8K0IFC4_COCNU|nr:putative Receptor-like protein EIX1 [Cocos nucifera]
MASTNTSIPLAYVIWIGFLLSFGSVQLCLCFSGNGSRSGSCIEKERKALLSIRKGIYDAHRWLSWNGKDCCRWSGVQCDTTTRHVVKLDLHYPYPYDVEEPFEERGPNKSVVSPSLLHLRHLNYLDLSMNNFRGAPIPDFIGSLANLEYLNLSQAGFGGTIPHQLGNLSNLLYLDLNHLYLLDVDNLGWLAQIRSLRYLDMSSVDLSKASNWIHVINMLPSLSILFLSGATLSGLSSTLPHVNFTSLTILDLSSNSIAQGIPDWLFNLSSLEHLDLGYNQFHGNIPLAIGNLKNLRSIDLLDNKISGGIPETMGNLESLEYLDLSANIISGGIPETVGHLKSLESLDLSGNNISGEIAKTIGRLTKLQILNLGDNKISGEIPATVGNLTELRIIDLSYNVINGQIPETVGNLHHLEELHLQNNSLAGVIPRTVGNLCNLRDFDASENNISGYITGFMEGFPRCSTKRLQSIDLHNNNLSGPLPSQIGELRSLVYLVVHGNSLSGSIPASLGKLSALSELDLSSNSLNGSIPASLGKLFALSSLDLSSNSLSGALTEAHFANLTKLFHLDLSYNSLTMNVSQDWLPPFKAGFIRMASCPLGPKFPPWLRNQTELSVLDLSSAGISKNFPDWFWDMGLPYHILYVSHNYIKGKLPISIKKREKSILLGFTDYWPSAYYRYSEGRTNYKLTFMDLSSNLFFGPIPPALASGIDNFNALLLAHNRISGSIPSAFCEANYLIVLNLANNDLSGVLPDCWNNSLQVIDFSDNKLSGGIPSSMGSLSQLYSLHLRNNNLFPSKWYDIDTPTY